MYMAFAVMLAIFQQIKKAAVSLKMRKGCVCTKLMVRTRPFCVGRSMWAMEIVEFQIAVGVTLELLLI